MDHKEKYIKYKTKYLKLKNNLDNLDKLNDINKIKLEGDGDNKKN
jgi:hypothetical protein